LRHGRVCGGGWSLKHFWNSTSCPFRSRRKIIRHPFEKREEGPRRRTGFREKREKSIYSCASVGNDSLHLQGVSPDLKFHQTLPTVYYTHPTSVCYIRRVLINYNTW